MTPPRGSEIQKNTPLSSQESLGGGAPPILSSFRRKIGRSASWSASDRTRDSKILFRLKVRPSKVFQDVQSEGRHKKKKEKKGVTFKDHAPGDHIRRNLELKTHADPQLYGTQEKLEGPAKLASQNQEASCFCAFGHAKKTDLNSVQNGAVNLNTLESYQAASRRERVVYLGRTPEDPKEALVLSKKLRAIARHNEPTAQTKDLHTDSQDFGVQLNPERRPTRMRTVSKDDYLLARGANPRTGVVTPSIHSDRTAIGEIEDDPSQKSSTSKWRLKGNQWILGEPSPTSTPQDRLSPEPPPVPLKYGLIYGNARNPSNVPIREMEDRFVVNMPSASEPCPPQMTPRQIKEYQKGIERVKRQGRVMIDPDILLMPGYFPAEEDTTPTQSPEKALPSTPVNKKIRRKAIGSPASAKQDIYEPMRVASQETVVTKHNQDNDRSASRTYFSPDDVGKDISSSAQSAVSTDKTQPGTRPFLAMREGDWVEDVRGSILRKGRNMSAMTDGIQCQSPSSMGTRTAQRMPSSTLPVPMTTSTFENMQTRHHPDVEERQQRARRPSLTSKPLPRFPQEEPSHHRPRKPSIPMPPTHNTFPRLRQYPPPLGPRLIIPRNPQMRKNHQQRLQDVFINPPSTVTSVTTRIPINTTHTKIENTRGQGMSADRPGMGQRLDGMHSVPQVSLHQQQEDKGSHHQHMTSITNVKKWREISDGDLRARAHAMTDSEELMLSNQMSNQASLEDEQYDTGGCTGTQEKTIGPANETRKSHRSHLAPEFHAQSSGPTQQDVQWLRDAGTDVYTDENTVDWQQDTLGSWITTGNGSIGGAKTMITRAVRNSLRLRRVRVRTKEIEGEGLQFAELPEDSDRELEDMTPVPLMPLQPVKQHRLASSSSISNRSVSGSAMWLMNPTGVTALDALLELAGRILVWAKRYKLFLHAKVVGQRLLEMLMFVVGTAIKLYEVTVYQPVTKKGSKGKPLPALPGEEVLGLLRDCVRAGVYALMLVAALLAVGRVVRMLVEAGGWVVWIASAVGWVVKKVLF